MLIIGVLMLFAQVGDYYLKRESLYKEKMRFPLFLAVFCIKKLCKRRYAEKNSLILRIFCGYYY